MVTLVTRRFLQVDVFGAEPYLGNALAVVVDAGDLTTEQMARFTRWTNLSQAAFVVPPTDPQADYRVRIFTSASDSAARKGLASELPFAGHPTLGACHAWLATIGTPRREDLVVQECGAGLVAVKGTDHGLAFAAPPLIRTGPLEEDLLDHIASALGIPRATIMDGAWTDNGPGWAAVLLPSAEAVLSLRPGFVDLDLGVVGGYPKGSPYAFEVRAFFPKDGATAEDPVTGSLNAAVAQWLFDTGRATSPYVASQGTVLGRAGRISIDRDDGGRVWVGGTTMTCVDGHVAL